MATQKWVSLSTSVSIDQKQEIERGAEASGMSVNEYIKARLFIDEQEPIIKISSLDKFVVELATTFDGIISWLHGIFFAFFCFAHFSVTQDPLGLIGLVYQGQDVNFPPERK